MLPVTEAGSLNQSSQDCEAPFADGRLPLMIVYISVLIIGLPANLLTVFLTWLQVRRKNVLGVYLWSLSLCDLTYLCTLPLWTDYIYRGHLWQWSSAACKLTGYIFFTNMYVSIFLLCCISLDRYMAVAYCLEARGMRRQRYAVLTTVTIVVMVAVVHTAVFTMREGAVTESSGRCFEPNRSSTTVMGFNFARFIIGFLLPLLLLAVTNRSILASAQHSAGLQRGQKRRVQWLTIAVVLLFLVCFAPYHLILLARAIMFRVPPQDGTLCLFEKTMYTPYTISLGLSTINSAVNPILYVLSSNNIRKELRQGLTQICSWGRHRPPSSSSQNQIQPSDKSLGPCVGTEAERQVAKTPAKT
uniref:G protein-coupled receptor 132 n=2 Tax=Nothobranchius pienaari TaxID=704102 RepID=A0A1A8MWK0_9TELE